MHFVPKNQTFWNFQGLSLLLIMLLVGNLAVGAAVAFGFSQVHNVPLATVLQMASGKLGFEYTNMSRWFHFLTFLGFMLAPSLVLLTISNVHATQVIKYRLPGAKNILLSMLCMILAIPLAIYFTQMMEQIAWPEGLKQFADNLNSARQQQFKIMLPMPNVLHLAICLGLLALLPALAEELMFRGIIQSIVLKKTNKVGLSIVSQAVLFTLLHFSLYEFMGILAMGILLGILAYKFGLLASIVAHIIFNATTVIAEYMSQHGNELAKHFAENSVAIPWWIAALGIVIVGVILGYKSWAKR